MDELTLLKQELREAKEELVRREREHDMKGLTTVCPIKFQRLTHLGEDELEEHIERLERDIEDLTSPSNWQDSD